MIPTKNHSFLIFFLIKSVTAQHCFLQNMPGNCVVQTCISINCDSKPDKRNVNEDEQTRSLAVSTER